MIIITALPTYAWVFTFYALHFLATVWFCHVFLLLTNKEYWEEYTEYEYQNKMK